MHWSCLCHYSFRFPCFWKSKETEIHLDTPYPFCLQLTLLAWREESVSADGFQHTGSWAQMGGVRNEWRTGEGLFGELADSDMFNSGYLAGWSGCLVESKPSRSLYDCCWLLRFLFCFVGWWFGGSIQFFKFPVDVFVTEFTGVIGLLLLILH